MLFARKPRPEPEPDGPEVPLISPVPPAKEQAAPQTAVPPTFRAAVRIGTADLCRRSLAWALAADDEAMERVVLKQRERAVDQARKEHREQCLELRNDIRAARAAHGRGSRAVTRLESAYEALAEQVPEDDARPITSGDITRARWSRRMFRCAIIAGFAYGGVQVLALRPVLLLAAVPALLFAAWRTGRQQPEDDKESSPLPHLRLLPDSDDGDGEHVPRFSRPAPEVDPTEGGDLIGPNVVLPGPRYVAVLEPEAPLPVADAQNRAALIETVKRALIGEGLQVAEVFGAKRMPWGWRVIVRLAKGKPADLIAKLADLETSLDLDAGGLRAQPLRRRACVQLNLVLTDPFADIGPAPYRAPNSLHLRDKVPLPTDMNGKQHGISLEGLQVLLVAKSGGGKSVIIRAFADVTTACDDVVNIDLDPGGNGVAPYAKAMNVRAVGPDQMPRIERTLEYLLAIGKARPQLFAPLGMGDNWRVSKDRPGFLIYIDEYPQLSPRAKHLCVAITQVARKSREELFIGSQDGTKAALGAAIADAVSLRMMGPSRHKDITLVFGEGAIAEGWRPDRLRPAEGDPAEGGDAGDASSVYMRGCGVWEPTVLKYQLISPAEGEHRADERARAGRPTPDLDSLRAAGIRPEWWAMLEAGGLPPALDDTDAYLAGVPDGDDEDTPIPLEPEQAQLLRDVLAVLDDDRAHLTALAKLLDDHNPELYGGWNARILGAALRAVDVATPSFKVAGKPNTGVYRDALQARLDADQAPPTGPPTD